MEYQVNVKNEGGLNNPYNIRIPPDNECTFPIDKYVQAIGLTGWNYNVKSSVWVGFDFDSITGHNKGLEHAELTEALEKSRNLDWFTIVRSTSGTGYHIFVLLEHNNIITNHREHSQLAHAILAKASALAGYGFTAKVDTCGSILWVWHRNQGEHGYELIKEGTVLSKIPNWQNSRGSRRTNYSMDRHFSDDAESLEPEHLRLIKWLEDNTASWWWDSDKSLLVCHTFNLLQAHKELNLRGIFNTVASGQSGAIAGSDHNAFATPISDGGWLLRRFGFGTKESTTWFTDSKGFTTCYYNAFSSPSLAASHYGGVESGDGEYSFTRRVEKAITQMGGTIKIPEQFTTRTATIKDLGTKLLVSYPKEKNDDNIEDWAGKGTKWVQVVQLPRNSVENRIRVPHGKIRHVVSANVDSGWFINATGIASCWVQEPRSNVRDVLISMGHNRGSIDRVMGKAINQHWTLVNEPFQPVYSGKRQWNKDAAQFSSTPILGNHSTWLEVLEHISDSLTLTIQEHSWCRQNNINTGYDYLFLWCARLFQQPKESLPYLFLYGNQNNGKSTFWEALSLLMTKGCIRADKALINSSGFNGELAGAILCVVEETDLSKKESIAYNRIKDWVTGTTISIRSLYANAYDTLNYTHWIQCGNKLSECPIIPGDTRITACYVSPLKDIQPKSELIGALTKEVPAILHAFTTYQLPPREGRLNIPIIETGEKQDAAEGRLDEVERFINEHCYPVMGEMILFSEFYERISSHTEMGKIAVGRAIPPQFPKGIWGGKGQMYIGNLSFSEGESKVKLQRVGKRLRREM